MGPASASRAALIAPLSAARWMLVIVIAAGVYFFHGFAVPVLAALVIALASWPLYSRLLTAVDGNRTLAATVALLAILSFLIVPIALAISYGIHEVRGWIGWALESNRNGAPTPEWIATLPFVGEWLNERWIQYIGQPGAIGVLIQLVSGANIGNIYRAVLAAGGQLFNLFLTLLFMLIALFFTYRDGEHFVSQVDKLGERILDRKSVV